MGCNWCNWCNYLPIYCVFVPLSDVRYRASHDMICRRVDMVSVVRVHPMVHYRRMVDSRNRPMVRGLVQAPRRALHVPGVDALVILRQEK